jgi:hypothetical protein
MNEANFTYEEMESQIDLFWKECMSIRKDRQADYGFHFMTTYYKYGLKGFLINDGEITARLERMEERISKYEMSPQETSDPYFELEARLKNALLDKINYCSLFLFWLEQTKYRNKVQNDKGINSSKCVCDSKRSVITSAIPISRGLPISRGK